MLNAGLIERMVEAKTHRRLLARVLDNGRPVDPSFRRRLLEPDTAVIAALGLALQRLCELTYAPDPAASRLARMVRARLEALHRAPGPGAPAFDLRALPAAAIALRALHDWSEACRTAPPPPAGGPAPRFGNEPPADAVVDEGIRAVAAAVRDPRWAGRAPVELAIARWQLGAWLDTEARRATAA